VWKQSVAISVTGVGWDIGGSYQVYFDSDGDHEWDASEPKVDVTYIAADGSFSTTLTAPDVPWYYTYTVHVCFYCAMCSPHWLNLASASFECGPYIGP